MIKKILFIILAGGIIYGGAETLPLVSQPMKWVGSYETICFDTSDGDLDIGQYAEAEGGYYVRTKPKSEAQFEFATSTDISKLDKVKVKGEKCGYYDEFQGQDGKIKRVPSTSKKYWDTAKIKNYPQSAKNELVPLLGGKKAKAAIALDATSNSGAKSSVSSYSWSHTCTGANGILVVGDSHYNPFGDKTVTGITFNADALTPIRSDVTGNVRTSLYFMVAPDTGGEYTVAVTLSASVNGAIGGAISYTGAAQTGQPDANNGANNSTGTTAATTVTTIADNSWAVAVLAMSYYNPVPNNTQRWEVLVNATMSGAGSDTNAPKTPAGDQVMSWTWSNNIGWAISAASFAPAGEEPPAATPTLTPDDDYHIYQEQ